MLPDGTDVRQLTRNDASPRVGLIYAMDWSPAWSPDGTHIAFSSGRDGDVEIYTMRADGTDVRQLTRNDAAWDGDPAWSP